VPGWAGRAALGGQTQGACRPAMTWSGGPQGLEATVRRKIVQVRKRSRKAE
jgi:hypothetical protein